MENKYRIKDTLLEIANRHNCLIETTENTDETIFWIAPEYTFIEGTDNARTHIGMEVSILKNEDVVMLNDISIPATKKNIMALREFVEDAMLAVILKEIEFSRDANHMMNFIDEVIVFNARENITKNMNKENIIYKKSTPM